jgi:hypothetical protein
MCFKHLFKKSDLQGCWPISRSKSVIRASDQRCFPLSGNAYILSHHMNAIARIFVLVSVLVVGALAQWLNYSTPAFRERAMGSPTSRLPRRKLPTGNRTFGDLAARRQYSLHGLGG